MSIEADNVEGENIDRSIQEEILLELRRISTILMEVHDLEINHEDVENDGD